LIDPFDFQRRASAKIASRFAEYLANRPLGGTQQNPRPIPFYQALASITASGKTVILAEAVSEIMPLLPVKPLILWLSKGKVVVRQTYANLQDGGKYRHLLGDFTIRLLAEYKVAEVADEDLALVFFATVGTFNQKSKDKSSLLLFKSDLDNKEQATWDALKLRETSDGIRRPLLVVYDEAQNLTDQQTDLLMELDPDGFLVASATMRLPAAFARLLTTLKERGWTEETLTTHVSSREVAASGLVKCDVVMGGYTSAMTTTVDDLLQEMAKATATAKASSAEIEPKAIYVCKTNIKEGNSFQRDDPKRPFKQREAPPIVIWRYLVEQQHVDPASVAVYCNLDFDKNFPHPVDFVLFKGGDSDYENFAAGNYKHIIFNLSLQEGWDDPNCYFAYIDKSMGSSLQVEQVVGRLLRQPGARHYESDILNTAHFYVRVDTKGVFGDIVSSVRQRLSGDDVEVRFSSYEGKSNKPVDLPPLKARSVSHIYLDPTDAVTPIQQLIDDMSDYRIDSVNTRGEGARAMVQQRVGHDSDAEIKWVTYDHNNPVSARWVFQLAVSRLFPRALEVAPSDDEKFDAKIEINSSAYKHIEHVASEVVEKYLEYVRLKQGASNPYTIGSQMVDMSPGKHDKFNNALHEAYSGLNNFEKVFAHALDKSQHVWCRNPSRSGFGIPLVSIGQSKSFYPDFLVWKGNDVYAIDTTGGHLLLEKTNRKLLTIEPAKAKGRLYVRLVAEGKWDKAVQPTGKEGYTLFALGPTHEIIATHHASLPEVIKACLTGT
jgi:type III restriction enzyme